jgi:hypothetical protein
MKRMISRWTEKAGVVRFREPLISPGWSGKRWLLWLRANRYQVGVFAQAALLSPAFRPNAGFEYCPVILKWPLWSDRERTIDNVLRTATGLATRPTTLEAACLMRRAFTDDEFEAMAVSWLNVLHPSVETSFGLGELDIIARRHGGRWLSGHVRPHDYRHPRDESFLVDDARSIERDEKGRPFIRRRKPPSSLPPEPSDYDDSEQMSRYLAELHKFFHIE